jgi:hypothetical protein
MDRSPPDTLEYSCVLRHQVLTRRIPARPQLLVSEFRSIRVGVAGDDLAFAEELPFVDHQAMEADGAAGVDFVGADADCGSSLRLPKGVGVPRLPLTARPDEPYDRH